MQKELHELSRAELLLGEDGLSKLKQAKVAVFGIGGVGSFATEALARGGIGHLTLIDGDCVSLTNMNRQLIATQKTVGQFKTEVMKERIYDILPQTTVETHSVFFTNENRGLIDFGKYDYIVDAIDMITSKIILIEEAKKAGVPIISCMGAGNKMDASAFQVADIYKTSVCPLARVMRHELKKRRVKKLKVVYSKELPITPIEDMAISCRTHCICPAGTVRKCTQRRQVPGSNAFVPAAAGLILAGEVVKDLSNYGGNL